MIGGKTSYMKCPKCGNLTLMKKEEFYYRGSWIYKRCETEGCSYTEYEEFLK